MPNWCEQVLYAPKEVLEQIVSEEEKGSLHLDFNKLIPMPAHQPDISKPNAFYAEGGLSLEDENKYGFANCWYGWSLINWGTKWNACYSQVDLDKGLIYFSTAWSPAEPFIRVLMDRFPDKDIRLDFDEPGECFRGYFTNDNGLCIEHDLSWHYAVEENDGVCPECGGYMYTSEGDDISVTKVCEDCGHETKINNPNN